MYTPHLPPSACLLPVALNSAARRGKKGAVSWLHASCYLSATPPCLSPQTWRRGQQQRRAGRSTSISRAERPVAAGDGGVWVSLLVMKTPPALPAPRISRFGIWWHTAALDAGRLLPFLARNISAHALARLSNFLPTALPPLYRRILLFLYLRVAYKTLRIHRAHTHTARYQRLPPLVLI